ncbi:chemotaxis protein CheC [Nitrosopumilus sp.]|uniref:chemotaxis protein CheC n=1 Tax=Nitrosopumilus sp. TaxID=2024843 RepID=UPI00262AC321|nr:chemotaxis protein CheC [Nitrosopumilus sp.]
MLLQTEIDKLTGTFNDFITDKTCDALSTLLKEPITHKLSLLEDGASSLKNECMPSDEIKMCSVRLNGKGDLHIELLYTTKLNHGIKIASKLLGTEVNEIDEMGTSALQEVANILTGSFFNALSQNTGFKVDLSTPTFKEGEIKDLIVEPVCDVVNPKDDAIITDVLLSGKETGTEIHMLIIQHPDHAKKLISNEARKINSNDYANDSNTNLLGGENSAIDDLLADLIPEETDSENNFSGGDK